MTKSPPPPPPPRGVGQQARRAIDNPILRRRLRTLLIIAWISYLLVIVAASLLPPGDLPVRVRSHDKLWHAAGYALAMLLAVPLWRGVLSLTGVALALAAMGAAIEVLQGITGYRSMELADALANASGVLVGLPAMATRLRGSLCGHDRDSVRSERFGRQH